MLLGSKLPGMLPVQNANPKLQVATRELFREDSEFNMKLCIKKKIKFMLTSNPEVKDPSDDWTPFHLVLIKIKIVNVIIEFT